MITVAVIAGGSIRFYNLEQQEFFADELVTSMYVSGVPADKATREIRTPDDCSKYERLAPQSSIATVFANLSRYGADQPPLYYLLCRFWAEATGDKCSGEALRPLSAIFGILLIPATFWLCLELFNSRLAGGIGAALIALCPYCLYWSQHSRPYSLWSLTVTLSIIALLRALRTGNTSSWLTFVALSIASFYTHLLTIVVLAAEAVYVLIIEKFRPNQRVQIFFVAIGVVGLSILPWQQCLGAGHYSTNSEWMLVRMSLIELVHELARIVCSALLDVGWIHLGSYPLILTMLLLATSVVYLSRKAQPRAALFVIILVLFPLFSLLARDLVRAYQEGRGCSFELLIGNFSVLIQRYIIPSLLGLQLCVAFWFANNLRLTEGIRRNLTVALFSIFLAVSVGAWISKQSTVRPDLPAMAKIVNGSSNQILVVSSSLCAPLCRLLDMDVKLFPIVKDKLPGAVNSSPEFYVLSNRSLMRAVLKNSGKYRYRSCEPSRQLWKVTRKNEMPSSPASYLSRK